MVLAMADLDEALAIYDAALAEAHRRRLDHALRRPPRCFAPRRCLLRGDLAEAEADAARLRRLQRRGGRLLASRALAAVPAFLAEALMEQGKLDEAAPRWPAPAGDGPPEA